MRIHPSIMRPNASFSALKFTFTPFSTYFTCAFMPNLNPHFTP